MYTIGRARAFIMDMEIVGGMREVSEVKWLDTVFQMNSISAKRYNTRRDLTTIFIPDSCGLSCGPIIFQQLTRCLVCVTLTVPTNTPTCQIDGNEGLHLAHQIPFPLLPVAHLWDFMLTASVIQPGINERIYLAYSFDKNHKIVQLCLNCRLHEPW